MFCMSVTNCWNEANNKKISHPVLLQVNQLSQPLQEGRLRDLAEINMKLENRNCVSEFPAADQHHIPPHHNRRQHCRLCTKVMTNLWQASPGSADVHPCHIVPRPEQAHLGEKKHIQTHLVKRPKMLPLKTNIGQPTHLSLDFTWWMTKWRKFSNLVVGAPHCLHPLKDRLQKTNSFVCF